MTPPYRPPYHHKKMVTDNQTYYLTYYLDYVLPEGAEEERLRGIYRDTKKKRALTGPTHATKLRMCSKLTEFEVHSFATAWISDFDEGREMIGPNFTMAVAYHQGTAHDVSDDLVGEWFMEAAIRDYLMAYPDRMCALSQLKTMLHRSRMLATS
jgi:hypothetical protein